MNENILTESDFNLTSKNNTINRQNNILLESMGLTTDTMSKLVVAEEFPHANEGDLKESECNLSVDQEEIFWMNYSIKNLHDQIRKGKN